MIVCKVKALRSAVTKRDAFGVLPCPACALNDVCDRKYRGRKCNGCSVGINNRSSLAFLRRECIRRAWAVFSDLTPVFGEVNLKKNICGTPSAELKAEYLS